MNSAPGEPPPLLVDAMLGRLCKWLRLIGYDAVYANHWPDTRIAAQARAQGRTVLTRDRELTRQKGFRCLHIDSQTLEAQIDQVVRSLGRPTAQSPTRCVQCNTPLLDATREQARAHVPPYVWETQPQFRYCPACDRYYWQGTHWQHVQAALDRM